MSALHAALLGLTLALPAAGPRVGRAAPVWAATAATAATSATAASAPRPDRETRPPVSVAGAPRSLVTLIVPVPQDLHDATALQFSVELSGRVDVMGRLDGSVAIEPDGRPSPIMLTLRVPSDALVGLLDVADVVFKTADGREVAVPIILRVPAVLALRLQGQRELQNVAAGDRVELAYRLQNLGNAQERLAVELELPGDWRTNVARTIVVAPFGATEIPVSLRVPPGVEGAGDRFVRLTLRRTVGADTGVVASATTVLRMQQVVARSEGLQLEPFVATAASSQGSGVMSGVRLQGPIGRGIRVFAQGSPLPPSGTEAFLLSTVGAMPMPFQATVSAEHWQVSGGATAQMLGELYGVNLAGRGASGSYEKDGRGVVAIAATPGFEGNGGQLVGARGWQETEFGRIGVGLSLLEDAGAATGLGRRLTAFGSDWTSRPLGSVTVGAGLALRSFGEGAQLGSRLQIAHETDRDQVRLRVMHAPGGSRAFAFQTDELTFDARRRLTDRLSLQADAFRGSDGGGLLTSVRNTGYGVGPSLALGDRTSVGLRFSTAASEARSSLAGVTTEFGTRTTGVSSTVGTRLGAWSLGGDATVQQYTRRSTLLSGAVNERRAALGIFNVGAARTLAALGAVSAGVSLTAADDASGLPGQTVTAFARWSGLPLFVGRQLVLAESEIRHFQTDVGPSQLAYRLGLTTRFRSGFEVAALASQSPLVRDASGRAGWVMALRVTASTDVLAGDRLAAPGSVYLDLNGDGRRGPGEEGVRGVVLRYGNQRISTGRDGSYRLPPTLRGRLQVDAASLPRGFVVPPRVALDSTERRDIPLVPTGRRAVVLTLQMDPDGRVPDVDLSKADVWLRDADGFEWVGQAEGDGRFIFDQVPVGTYQLRLSFERLAEPVRADEVQVTIGTGAQESLVVPVRGRTVRIINPPRGGGRGGASGGTRASPRAAPRNAAPQGLVPTPDA